MTTEREVLLAALRGWRAEGAISEEQYERLSARYHSADVLVAAPATTEPGPRRSFAADAMQFVGGLLVGAALVALVFFLDVTDTTEPWLFSVLGLLLLAPAVAASYRNFPDGLVEAGLAGGLVPLAFAAGMAVDGGSILVPIFVTIVSVGIAVLRRGLGPTTLVAGVAFTIGSAASTILYDFDIFGEPVAWSRWAWFALLASYTALMLLWRHRIWAAISLGALVVPLTFAFGAVALLFGDPSSVVMELVLGGFYIALLAIGIVLGSRGLVTGAGAALTIDAVVFATDVGGPGTAVVVLLALGGLLVWQAELVRNYYRRGPS